MYDKTKLDDLILSNMILITELYYYHGMVAVAVLLCLFDDCRFGAFGRSECLWYKN